MNEFLNSDFLTVKKEQNIIVVNIKSSKMKQIGKFESFNNFIVFLEKFKCKYTLLTAISMCNANFLVLSGSLFNNKQIIVKAKMFFHTLFSEIVDAGIRPSAARLIIDNTIMSDIDNGYCTIGCDTVTIMLK